MGRRTRTALSAAWLALSLACAQPALVSQSSIVPLPSAGSPVSDRGTWNAHAALALRTGAYGTRAGAPSTESALSLPRLQLEGDLAYRPDPHFVASLVYFAGLPVGADPVEPTTLRPPPGGPYGTGVALAVGTWLGASDRIDLSARALGGSVPSATTFRSTDTTCITPPCPMPTYRYDTGVESLSFVTVGATLAWSHRLGPARTTLLAGLGNQPVNGALGGATASIAFGPVYGVAGAVLELWITEGFALTGSVLFPIAPYPFDLTPMLGLGFSIAADPLRGDPASPDALSR